MSSNVKAFTYITDPCTGRCRKREGHLYPDIAYKGAIIERVWEERYGKERLL